MVNNSFLEAFEELDALYSEELTEAAPDFHKARVVTTYKGYKIYEYQHENTPGYKNDKGVPEPYSSRYYGQDSNGKKLAVGETSVENCKKAIDNYLHELDYDARLEKAEKLIDTTAATYRGCSIYYKNVVDPDQGTYTYYVAGDARMARLVVADIKGKSFKSIDDAKKAIDECIRDYNSYLDAPDKYKESLKRFIREALATLDTQD